MPDRREEAWLEEQYEAQAASSGLRKERFVLSDGTEIKPLYLPGDAGEQSARLEGDLGFPGEPPFARGVQPTMYRGRLWTMRQYAGFGTAAESNERYRMLLAAGGKGLSVAFDLPTQMGLDSTDPLSAGEVGKVGVAIDSIEDMHVLFDGIPLDRVSTSMTINATAPILLALYQVCAEEQGVSGAKLRGTIQNDVLKEYIARGTYIYPAGPSLRLITDVFAYCKDALPRWNTISISGYHIREAGCDAVQEVAFTLANGLTYVQAAIDAGLDINDFAGRLAFFFNVHNGFLEEIAKFRAARRLWARLLGERHPACTDENRRLRFHTQTAGSALTAQQPDNNVARVTIQALAAVLGGTQSLHTNSLDEALGLPSEHAAQIALRTQQVIASESGVADFIDPLAGSYAIEALTDHIERSARELIERVDAMGGVVRAIEAGWIQKQILDTAYRYQQGIDSGAIEVVGVNVHAGGEGVRPEIQRIDPEGERQQRARVKALRAKRDKAAAEGALTALEAAARTDANLMPLIVTAVRARCTLGEIAGTMRRVFGVYRETLVI
ncbi:MAG: methylmalonyl-CoA mutase [Deltaproteobacteria bacterium]|nr:methylmalonyl-CoA mutase [Deltaproteobacteria bacterium]